MSQTKAAPKGPSESDARAVAEGARETEWTHPSFVRELFLGRFQLDLIHPYPKPDPEEQKRAEQFLSTFERFLVENVDPEEIETTGKIPDSVVNGLKKIRAFGIKIPTEYGGLGLSQYSYGKAMAMASQWSSSLVTLLSAHQSIGVPIPVKMFGTPEQKKKYLPRCADGAISAFALTEVDVGSDPARMSTTAVPTEDGSAYILNGEKLWCTNGTIAELMVVMATVPAGEGKRGKITAFIVEADTPGIEVVNRLEFMGLKGIENALLRFTNVRVPKENVLLGEGKGLKLALSTLNTGRLTLPTACAAAGKWCLQVVREWAAERVQWGKPIGHHEAMAQKISDMACRTYAMDAISDFCTMHADRGTSDIRMEAAIAKLFNSDTAWEITDEAMQVRGGRGYETAASLKSRGEKPIPLERLMRDLRINRIFEGSNEILRLFITREAVDTHLKAAGDLLDPKISMGKKIAATIKAGLFYAVWYPQRWIGWGRWPQYSEFGPLADHLRYVDRTSRRLARAQFHTMMKYQAGLERRQAVLFRLVDVGVELFAMSAVCARAQRDVQATPADRSPYELADLYCRRARRKIASLFRAVDRNDDSLAYKIARKTLDGGYAWLENGVFGLDELTPAPRKSEDLAKAI